jgi:hypothetical protein
MRKGSTRLSMYISKQKWKKTISSSIEIIVHEEPTIDIAKFVGKKVREKSKKPNHS